MREVSVTDVRRAVRSIELCLEQEEKAELETFRDVLESLTASVLGSFRRDEWPGYCQLNQVFIKNCGLPVPSLSICGQGTAEIRYTKLLCWFLDSKNPHGLGGRLCEAVFKPAFEAKEIQSPSFRNCRARAEVGLGQTKVNEKSRYNSLDILVESVGEWIICIEQKVGSAEGQDQLQRYNQALENLYDESQLMRFFLTPEGKPGSQENWIPISYLDIIQRMASVLEYEVLYPVARFNLKALLWDLLLGPLAQDELWLRKFREHVKKVANAPDRHFAAFSSWLERYQINEDARRILLRLVEV